MANQSTESAWPLRDAVEKLIEAADHLHESHDCDTDGYEQWRAARNAAFNWLTEPTIAQPTESPAETAWLLEKEAAQPTYICISGGIFEWTMDIDKAFRCARREDADALAEIIEDCDRVVEHLWR